MKILFVIIAVLVGLGWCKVDFDETVENVLIITRCRAGCLDQFCDNVRLEARCKKDPNCFMCWDACHLLMENYSIWSPICGVKDICRPGCKKACSVINDPGMRSTIFVSSSKMSLRYVTDPRHDRIRVDWTPKKDLGSEGTMLYSVLLTDERGEWYQFAQTTAQSVYIRRGLLKHNTPVRVIAANASRVVSDTEVTYQDNNLIDSDFPVPHRKLGSDFPVPHLGTMRPGTTRHAIHRFGIVHTINATTSSWKPTMEYMEYSQMSNGLLTTISWPMKLAYPGPVKYEISWYDVDDIMEVTGHLITPTNVVSITLWPDSLYVIQVKCLTDDDKIFSESGLLIVSTKDAYKKAVRLTTVAPVVTPPVKCEKDTSGSDASDIAINAFAFLAAFFLTILIMVFVCVLKRSKKTKQVENPGDPYKKVQMPEDDKSTLHFKFSKSGNVIKSDSVVDLESQVFQVI